MTYDPTTIEAEWQRAWQESNAYEATDSPTDPMYILAMFPYPSGSLHMGHVRNYTITDALARYHRLVGKDVLHPFGWDAFGLPAENAAHERNTDPQTWTDDCIREMRQELTDMGFGYDWDREIKTADPSYYRWNQWLFKRLFEEDLVTYRAAPVNWCPSCSTVLADAQVEDDACWRCETPVETQERKQWFIKTTEYADQLVENLDSLDGWPETVREQQRNWIGKTTGHSVVFEAADAPTDIRAFTTRLETIEGATFAAVSPEHTLAQAAARQDDGVQQYLNERTNTDDTTAGIQTPFTVTNPVTEDPVPVYIAEYVEEEVGTGAIMAVPAHDERDHAFAVEHDIPIVQVVGDEPVPFTDATVMTGGQFEGKAAEDAREQYAVMLPSATERDSYRLNDWLISRQRYWGTPIPIIHCDDCGRVPVPDEKLPVEVPEFVRTTRNPLAENDSFREVNCPSCGQDACRETDTMDTFVDSSWYFLRYLSPHEDELLVTPEAANNWTPVDRYVGGDEHAVTHLLYARFVMRFLYEEGYVDEPEPFDNLITQGMVLLDGAKMSKSRGNVVSPQRIVEEYGADTARWFMMGAAAPKNDFDWQEDAVEGAADFLQSIHTTVTETATETRPERPVDRFAERVAATTAETARAAYENGELHRVEPAVRTMMQWVNRYCEAVTPRAATFETVMSTLLRIIEPIAPHVAQEAHAEFDGVLLAAEGTWPAVGADPISMDSISRIMSDIQSVATTVGVTDESTLEIVTAPPWRYDMATLVDETDTDDVVSTVMQEDRFKQHGNDAASYAQELQTSYIPTVSEEEEVTRYKELAGYIMAQYDFENVAVYPYSQYHRDIRREPRPDEPYLNIET